MPKESGYGLQKTIAFEMSFYYYWNQAGEVTPTKARLTSLKTPEATPRHPFPRSLYKGGWVLKPKSKPQASVMIGVG